MIQNRKNNNFIFNFIQGLSIYERWYLLCALVLTSTFAILFPAEEANGITGKVILALSVLYTILNVICELLIAKQDKWNFVVSWCIEVVEIVMYSILGYRFATLITTIFFWIPIDTISFISWRKHPDNKEKEITRVRKLSGRQKVFVIIGIIVWTVAFGSLIVKVTGALADTTDIFDENQRHIAIICIYLDAMVSALDICNGSFILLRYQEQWIAWYLEVIMDAIVCILGGQYIMLALTACYLTNTTYGYVKWGRYIKTHDDLNDDGI